MPENLGSHWPLRASLSSRLIGGIMRCRNHLWERDSRVAGLHDLTWPQFVVLSVLRSEAPDHGMTPKDIGREAQVTTGGLSKILILLEKRGFVTRESSLDDGRRRLVRLTPEGKTVAEQIFGRVVELNDVLLREALSDEECEDLARLVRKLSGYLDDMSDKGQL